MSSLAFAGWGAMDVATLYGVIYFGCCRRAHSSTPSQPLAEQAAGGTEIGAEQPGTSSSVTLNVEMEPVLAATRPSRGRLGYLDTLKAFLTFTVVTHHIGCVYIGYTWGGAQVARATADVDRADPRSTGRSCRSSLDPQTEP